MTTLTRDACFAAVAAGTCPLCGGALAPAFRCDPCRVTFADPASRDDTDYEGDAFEPWASPVEYERPGVDADACARCGAPDPSNGHTVVLFRFADTDAEDLGALCDRCAFDFQNGFLGNRSGLNCAHCGDREPKSGWARVVSGAPTVWSAIDDEEGGEDSDDPICAECVALVRAYVNPGEA